MTQWLREDARGQSFLTWPSTQQYELVLSVGYDNMSAAWPSGLLACGTLTL